MQSQNTTQLSEEDAEEYTQALALVHAGGWRQVALGEKLGVPKALGLSTRDWVEQRLGGYVRLSIEERKQAALELTEAEGLSVREAADVLGVSKSTVHEDVQNRTEEEADEPESVQNRTESPAESETPSQPHVAHATGENEWYTPQAYIAAARLVMGDIDLDPASSELANTVVQAKTYYTMEHNGLDEPWEGRVWLNPPYAADLVGKFTAKLREHFMAGDVTEAIVLVNNATETEWFQGIADVTQAFCFPRQRVKFWGPKGQAGAPLQGQAVLYLGWHLDAFVSHFGSFGLLLVHD